MSDNRTLHVLNGQAMYHKYKAENFLNGERMIPFNEAMCYGETCFDIFSDAFVHCRAKVHGVTPKQYAEITLKPLKPLFNKSFHHIALWFDEDMFCQINIVTILAWLEQDRYSGSIELHIVDDQHERMEGYTLRADGYRSIYEQVLIHKAMPNSITTLPHTIKDGIELYLKYLHEDSEIIRMIESNPHLSEQELVIKLMAEFRHYGLGDTQYYDIIKANRR
ncbi:AraC family transcriptional regulator [Paenibacillus camelliae]|uniref:AraC family transcriptional regulator n=1 Tax=Paenibacillus camelliae TaxID=512410 RepID=UPI00203C818B|nr:AraC family transcriptional regulator [Paenibacillus camelliae]MCM3633432.1 AraC family transcriptional regulator [Paenibacillus camelliae]